MDILGLCNGPECWPIARPSPFKCTVRFRRGRPNYFQDHVLQLLTPADRLSSCVRGSATPCKLEHISLAIAGVRRLLHFRGNETDKTPHGARSKFPRPFDILRAAFDVLCKLLSRRRIVCSFLFSLTLQLVHFVRQQS